MHGKMSTKCLGSILTCCRALKRLAERIYEEREKYRKLKQVRHYNNSEFLNVRKGDREVSHHERKRHVKKGNKLLLPSTHCFQWRKTWWTSTFTSTKALILWAMESNWPRRLVDQNPLPAKKAVANVNAFVFKLSSCASPFLSRGVFWDFRPYSPIQ